MSQNITSVQAYLSAIETMDTWNINWETYVIEEARKSTCLDERLDLYKYCRINKRVD